MTDYGLSGKDNGKVRSYLRSSRFRILSWGATALLIVAFVFPQYRLRLLYGACAFSFLAMLPLISISRLRQQQLDLQSKRDRRILILVLIYVGGIILVATLWAMYAAKR